VRVRSVLAFATGAAAGAGAIYFLDPEHGPARRREARRNALTVARTQAVGLAGHLVQQVQQVAVAAVEGYRDGRAPDERAVGVLP
jgi:hypothetical protein